MSETASAGVDLPRRSAIRFIMLLGVADLFADMTYEGARSVTGPYLGVLVASAAVVGVVAGFGEFLGYALWLASGYLSDRTGSYWLITIIGYGVQSLGRAVDSLDRLRLPTARGAGRVGKARREHCRKADDGVPDAQRHGRAPHMRAMENFYFNAKFNG